MGKSNSAGDSAADPLDYQAWLRRAWNFIDGCRMLPDDVSISQIVKPPATKSEFQRSLSGLTRPVPRSLARWFREGSSYCDLSYHWKPQSRGLSPLQRRAAFRFGVGGTVRIGPICEICLWFDQCETWSEPLARRADRRSKRVLDFWKSAFPFCAFGDGDMLGVISSDSGMEPVVYLMHDSPADAFIVAPDFDDFLRRWEQLRYCDQNGLCFFSNGGKSRLNPSSNVAEQLRAWLPTN